MRGFAWRLQSRQRVKLLRPQRHEHFPRNADRKHHRLFDLGSRDDVLFAPAAAFLFLPAQFSVYRPALPRSEEHTSELQSRSDLVCRLLLEKKKKHSLLLPPSSYL